VYSEKLLKMERGTVRKHVEFYSKNKYEKLMHLVDFIIRIYTMHGYLNAKLDLYVKCPTFLADFNQI
jgi:hypothetical protein